jgi:hypothetical protein
LISGGSAAALLVAAATQALAQAPPTQASPDTPTVRVGGTLYADYTYTSSPESIDADGNSIHPSQFNVGRSYLNVTGNVSRLIAFRITPDISRETGAGSSLNGSLLFRIKYAYGQFNLDDWISPGSWARLGIQQTPIVDYEENIYRYRFQGTVFTEREGYMSSSDAGASFRYNLRSNYGEVHAGVYNGENYNRLEVNDQKSFQVRGTVRPFAQSATAALRGLRLTAFYTGDHYVKDAARNRFVAQATFEHRFLHAGFDYLHAVDQTSITKPELTGRGFSIWATPRSPSGWEALLRYDRLKPDASVDAHVRSRAIVGVAYWFPLQGAVSTALLLDYDAATFTNFTPALPKQRRVALHGLVGF